MKINLEKENMGNMENTTTKNFQNVWNRRVMALLGRDYRPARCMQFVNDIHFQHWTSLRAG